MCYLNLPPLCTSRFPPSNLNLAPAASGSLNSLQILAVVVVVVVVELDKQLSILSTQVDDLDLGLGVHLDVLCLHEQWRIVGMRMKAALPALCNVVQSIVRCQYKETSAAKRVRMVKGYQR